MRDVFSSKISVKLLLKLFLVPVTFLLVQCSDSAQEELIVPDNYVGPLLLLHNCPGGTPLEYKNGVVKIEFRNDGIACTSDYPSVSLYTIGKGLSHTRSGKPVPYARMIHLAKGELGLCYNASGEASEGYIQVNYFEWWYGPCNETKPARIYGELHDFFKLHFGFKHYGMYSRHPEQE